MTAIFLPFRSGSFAGQYEGWIQRPLNLSMPFQSGVCRLAAKPVFNSKYRATNFLPSLLSISHLFASSFQTDLEIYVLKKVSLRRSHFSATYEKYSLSSALPGNRCVHFQSLHNSGSENS